MSVLMPLVQTVRYSNPVPHLLRVAGIITLALFSANPLVAQEPKAQDLTQASLEDLMNIQVTSVSKKEQKLGSAAAAIFVITQEDIRRSGATSIPDLLRMVPGVDIAQIDSNTDAISIRGFNDRLADKVLVLIDGRTVYTPTTSGVYWDQQDVPLEDIDRIEVIRGPGATIWGANAVNGVVNIITKSSRDTEGLTVSAGGGSQNTARGLVQYGGKIGDDGTYRVFENYLNTGNLTQADGRSEAADGWHLFHSGFRSDWMLSSTDTLTVQGDFVQTGEGQNISVVFANALPLMRTFNDSVATDEGNLLARWNHVLSNGSDTTLQIYFDRYIRHDLGVFEGLDTLDFDFQHHIRVGSRNDVVWGAGYRFTADEHDPGYGKTYVPLAQSNSLASAFIQDEIRITDSLSLTFGSKFEHQPYSGFEFEPSLRLAWTPTDRHTFWMAASQAVKQVSREEAGLVIDPFVFPTPGGGFGVEQFLGNPTSSAERIRDYEIGYRTQVTPRLSMDLTTFATYYHDMESLVPLDPYFTVDQGPPHLVLPFFFGNSTDAFTYGGEMFATWNVTSRWKISPGYSAIHLKLFHDPGTQDADEQEREASTPENQFQVRSFLNLPHNLEWDSTLYYVGHLRDGGNGPVPAYTRVDTRLGWRFRKSLEVSVVGQNLLRPLHQEFHDAYELSNTLVERSVFARFTWRF
jgi:iron complex outermembrane receptor protein